MIKTLFCIFAAALLIGQLSAQTVPSATTYQGRLTDASGNPAPDGSGYEVEVRLWPTAAGTTGLLWGTRYSGVTVKGGALNLILGGGGTAISGAQTTDIRAAVASPSVFLGLTVTKTAAGTSVANPTEILPRQQWLSSPFAFRAEVAGGTLPGAVTSAMLAPGAVQTANIATGAVTNTQIAPGAVNLTSVAANSLNSSAIAAGSIAPDRLAQDYAVFEDRRSSGTGPGNSVVGWNTRVIGTTPAAISGTSITLNNDNTFTLVPGTYFVDADCPVLQSWDHQAALFESHALTTAVLLGTSAQGRIEGASGPHFAVSSVKGYLQVSGSNRTYVLRHYTSSVAELGRRVSSGQSEVYARIHIIRVK